MEKGARGMHIGKIAKTATGARVAAIAEKVPRVGVLGAGIQYAYHEHLLKSGSRGVIAATRAPLID